MGRSAEVPCGARGRRIVRRTMPRGKGTTACEGSGSGRRARGASKAYSPPVPAPRAARTSADAEGDVSLAPAPATDAEKASERDEGALGEGGGGSPSDGVLKDEDTHHPLPGIEEAHAATGMVPAEQGADECADAASHGGGSSVEVVAIIVEALVQAAIEESERTARARFAEECKGGSISAIGPVQTDTIPLPHLAYGEAVPARRNRRMIAYEDGGGTTHYRPEDESVSAIGAFLVPAAYDVYGNPIGALPPAPSLCPPPHAAAVPLAVGPPHYFGAPLPIGSAACSATQGYGFAPIMPGGGAFEVPWSPIPYAVPCVAGHGDSLQRLVLNATTQTASSAPGGHLGSSKITASDWPLSKQGRVGGGFVHGRVSVDRNGRAGVLTSSARPAKPASDALRKECIERTVHVSNIDPALSELQVGLFFSACGEIVDCRMLGGQDQSKTRECFIEFCERRSAKSCLQMTELALGTMQMRVRPSRTAIVPVDAAYLPENPDDWERCNRTIYACNIDGNLPDEAIVEFFRASCGPVVQARVLGGGSRTPTMIAFVEFEFNRSAVIAIGLSGHALGPSGRMLRICPSKTPIRDEAERSSRKGNERSFGGADRKRIPVNSSQGEA